VRAIARANLVLVGVDQRIQRRTVHQALFDEQRFERFHAQGEI
jgi:hypothetical protein